MERLKLLFILVAQFAQLHWFGKPNCAEESEKNINFVKDFNKLIKKIVKNVIFRCCTQNFQFHCVCLVMHRKIIDLMPFRVLTLVVCAVKLFNWQLIVTFFCHVIFSLNF